MTPPRIDWTQVEITNDGAFCRICHEQLPRRLYFGINAGPLDIEKVEAHQRDHMVEA